MASNNLFIIFAHARSGSNTLSNVLEQHPLIKIMIEPFNEDRPKWEKGNKNYKKRIKNKETFDKIIKEISKYCNGFKTLTYQLPEKYNNYLLKNKNNKIIFLYRKNILKGVVSGEIAEQTNVWTVEEKKKLKRNKLKPLRLPDLKKKIKYLSEDISYQKKILKKNSTPFIEVSYEELYEAPKEKRIQKIKQIFKFLELQLPLKNKMERINFLMNPKRRINNERIYRTIQNINEVEKEVGSKKNGFLFK